MPLFRKSKKQRRSKIGNEAPFIDMAKENVDPADRLFFDGGDPGIELGESTEQPPIALAATASAPVATASASAATASAPVATASASAATASAPAATASAELFRRLSKKKFQQAPTAGPEYPHTALFRRLKDEDKLRAWGADPVTGIRHENPLGYLVPTPTTSVRFVGSSLRPPAEADKLPGGHGPCRFERGIGSVSYLGSLPAMKTVSNLPASDKLKKNGPMPSSLPISMGPNIPGWLKSIEASGPMDIEPPPIDKPGHQRSKRKSRRSSTQPKDANDSSIQVSACNPRPTPVNPVKESTESPIKNAKLVTDSLEASPGQVEQRIFPFRIFLQILMSVFQHILWKFSQFVPAWKVLQNPNVTQGEFMEAWWTMWLAMVYFVMLWACFVTVGRYVCFVVEGVNWILRIVSLLMVFCIFSRCWLSNG